VLFNLGHPERLENGYNMSSRHVTAFLTRSSVQTAVCLNILFPFELQGTVVVKDKENFLRLIEFVHHLVTSNLMKNVTVKRNMLVVLLQHE
jgi:hypothetical protein